MAVPAQSYINPAGNTTHEALECLRRDLIAGDASCEESRRAEVWQALLLHQSSEPYHREVVEEARRHAESLRDRHLRNKPDEAFDPLSETESWQSYYKDQGLRNEIEQDCQRIFPEEEWFQGSQQQTFIRECLFIWSKDNPGISYRQGMHELAGIVTWVILHDSAFCDTHGLADIYALFSTVMQHAKHFYTSASSDTPDIILLSRRIQHEILPVVDHDLAEKLSHLGIEPQLYCMKWLRLLFSREFSFQGTLVLWDALFAADPSLSLVDYLCCAFLIRIRQQIIEGDYNVALTTLLRYPGTDISSNLYVQDAVYLRDHATPRGGTEVIENHRVGPPVNAKSQEMLSRGQPSNHYSITTLLEQTDRLGINHYVRGAVEEVRRNVTPIITETRQALHRTSSRESSYVSTPSSTSRSATAERDRELASILTTTISQLKNGRNLLDNIARLEDVKLVLQGRKTISDISVQSSTEAETNQSRPSTAPSMHPVTSSPRLTASPIKIPAIRSRARSPIRVAVETDGNSPRRQGRDEVVPSLSPKKSSLKKAADYSFLFDNDKSALSTFNQTRNV